MRWAKSRDKSHRSGLALLGSVDEAALSQLPNLSFRTAKRGVLISLAAGASALVVVPPAAPRPGGALFDYKNQAHFNMTIQGTYTTRGVEVDKDCFRLLEGDQEQQITVTRTGTESLQFKSTRSVRFDAYQFVGNSVSAGTPGIVPIAVTTTRTLTLSEPCHEADPAPQCGTKQLRLSMSVISRERPLRVFYSFSDRPGRIIFPDDPFNFSCSTPALSWWGKLSAPYAQMPAAKVFNKRLKRFTVSGAIAKSAHSKSNSASQDGRYELRYTVTFVRRAR